ncbi:MAG: HYR domain-containing protein, partial [Cyclobacteriaceae bacterium]|nr:HYR domain-containing protein [Cyclobacteriaceae bacterium]
GGASDIQSQSFADIGGCSGGASDNTLLYYVSGGTISVGPKGGPNGDDSYTFQELLNEFGTTDTNPDPQFTVDPDLVTSCGEVQDNTPPAITNLPDDITAFAPDNNCELAVNWTPPTITDEGGLQSISSNHNPGDVFQIGTNTVTYLAQDSAGNTNEKSFNITVIDNTPPVFLSCPGNYKIESIDSEAKTSIISWDIPEVEDACSDISLSSNYNPGDVFDFGITTVVYTATDQSGNIAHCSFDILSRLNTPPLADDMLLKAAAGQSIIINGNVIDPEGDQVFLELITNNANNSYLSNIDKENLQFIYTSFIDFYGVDTLYVILVDNGIPAKSTLTKVIIEVERVANIKIAGAITPDGDMMNDTWFIKDIDHFMENSVNIFDRWGGLLYQTTGYNNTSVVWDGTSNRSQDKRIPTGTYFYVIDLGNGSKKLTGAVELIR